MVEGLGGREVRAGHRFYRVVFTEMRAESVISDPHSGGFPEGFRLDDNADLHATR
jgi:hypothetical protein